jgi:hypothetical protein
MPTRPARVITQRSQVDLLPPLLQKCRSADLSLEAMTGLLTWMQQHAAPDRAPPPRRCVRPRGHLLSAPGMTRRPRGPRAGWQRSPDGSDRTGREGTGRHGTGRDRTPLPTSGSARSRALPSLWRTKCRPSRAGDRGAARAGGHGPGRCLGTGRPRRARRAVPQQPLDLACEDTRAASSPTSRVLPIPGSPPTRVTTCSPSGAPYGGVVGGL